MRTNNTLARARGAISDIIRENAGVRFTVLLELVIVAIAIGSAACSSTAAPVSPTVIARAALPGIPEGDWIFRVVDLTLKPGDSNVTPNQSGAPDDRDAARLPSLVYPHVTHAHGAGMTYALDGSHILIMDGKTTTLNPGEAAWVGDQVSHTHATDGKTPTHFLFMYLWPTSKKGAPMAPGFDVAKVAFESDNLTFQDRKAQDAVLAATNFKTGENATTQTYSGPAMVYAQTGSFSIKLGDVSQSLQAGAYLAVPAGTLLQVKANTPGRLLTLSIAPASQSTAPSR